MSTHFSLWTRHTLTHQQVTQMIHVVQLIRFTCIPAPEAIARLFGFRIVKIEEFHNMFDGLLEGANKIHI